MALLLSAAVSDGAPSLLVKSQKWRQECGAVNKVFTPEGGGHMVCWALSIGPKSLSKLLIRVVP